VGIETVGIESGMVSGVVLGMISGVALGMLSTDFLVESSSSTGCASIGCVAIGCVAIGCVAMAWLLEGFPWEEGELDWLEGLGATMRSG
jgi:hypothetical protein